MYLFLKKEDLLNLLHRYNLDKPLIQNCIELAEGEHRNQARDDGTSYLNEHIYPVVREIIFYYAFEEKPVPIEVVCIALLHDVLEDSNDDHIEAKIKDSLGESIFRGVKVLTKPRYHNFSGVSVEHKKQKRDLYYETQLQHGEHEIVLIKLADRLNNLQCILKSPKVEKILRYVAESERFYLPFAKKRIMYFYNKLRNVISEIKGELRCRKK